ncbi:hypothetical protein [Arcobacter sp. FWKO B]|uniref:hypothetical protein n=1 Tax=Arcobacter sp. FWKO B TaxID=2593672 RepID=UPI0018A383A9|nr:hypothetical protein [Arcobacter sp. FWKO B]QOG11399.1 hypothetical protein FWKOB_01220 [Arcobacter sp. FWKO B]
MKKIAVLLFGIGLCYLYAVDSSTSELKQNRFNSDIQPKDRSGYNQELREQKQQQNQERFEEKKQEKLQLKEQKKEQIQEKREYKEQMKEKNMNKFQERQNPKGNAPHRGMM